MAKITSCKIRMYTMGTGDCFLLSFFSDEDTVNPQFKLMIDCGVIRISETKMEDYAKDIVTSTNGKIDALLITHEHQDHVLGFERAEKIFTDSSKFEIDELWLPWTENITDPLVDTWNQEYGKKKKALAKATEIFKESLKNSIFNDSFKGVKNGANKIELKKSIFNGLSEMTALNGQPSNEYVGSLKGFDIAKKKIKKNSVRYLEPGTVLEKLDNLENIRIFILGPPKLWKSVSTLEGKGEEVYKHNKALEHLRGISSLPFEEGSDSSPFDEKYVCQNLEDCDCINNVTKQYLNGDIRRRIDFDWLTSTANLAMRVTTGINNLSAVLAIEFIDSGKIMLFPGDAEFGSWQSWHTITWPIWSRTQNFQKVTTAELLNRTIFYKVAHHLSSNGTAKKEGVALMPEKGLTAMATLDYDVIQKNWQSTMPNRDLLKDLLKLTDGRFIVSNEKNLFLDKDKNRALTDEITELKSNWNDAQKDDFSKRYHKTNLYIEYHLDGK